MVLIFIYFDLFPQLEYRLHGAGLGIVFPPPPAIGYINKEQSLSILERLPQ